jgi:hypothetical protein
MQDYERAFYRLALLVTRANEALQLENGENNAQMKAETYLSEAQTLIDSLTKGEQQT